MRSAEPCVDVEELADEIERLNETGRKKMALSEVSELHQLALVLQPRLLALNLSIVCQVCASLKCTNWHFSNCGNTNIICAEIDLFSILGHRISCIRCHSCFGQVHR